MGCPSTTRSLWLAASPAVDSPRGSGKRSTATSRRGRSEHAVAQQRIFLFPRQQTPATAAGRPELAALAGPYRVTASVLAVVERIDTGTVVRLLAAASGSRSKSADRRTQGQAVPLSSALRRSRAGANGGMTGSTTERRPMALRPPPGCGPVLRLTAEVAEASAVPSGDSCITARRSALRNRRSGASSPFRSCVRGLGFSCRPRRAPPYCRSPPRRGPDAAR